MDAPLLAAIGEWITPIYWQVEFGCIRRIAYHGEKHIEPNAPLPMGQLEVELITGIGCKYHVPIGLVADLLVADDPNANFEHRIAKEYGENSNRTFSSPGPDPAYGSTDRRSNYRNSAGMNSAIEKLKTVVSLPGDNSRWMMEKEIRLSQWIARIAMFSLELAEKEKARALASASRIADQVALEELKVEEKRALWVNFYAKSDKQADRTNTCNPPQDIEKVEALVKAVSGVEQVIPSVLGSRQNSTQTKPQMEQPQQPTQSTTP